MTDERDEPDEQVEPVSPQDDRRLRALLAEARETGSMPPAVAARLERTLAGLATERSSVGAADVVPITRTRRHRVVAVLGAAAAVAVLALGVGAILDRDSGRVDETTADSAVDRGTTSGDAAGPAVADTPTGTAADETLTKVAPSWVESVEVGHPPYVVRSRHLTHDLARIQGRVVRDGARYGKALIYQPRDFACASADWGRGILAAVRYDGAPAYVAFRQPVGASQVVEVLQCGTAELLRSTTLPTLHSR
jgi:hypothetical protein